MKTLKIILITISLFLTMNDMVFSQPFTKKYIMSFHTCGVNCNGFQDHKVNLAESDDGINWTLVPNFIPYGGSVPDVIIRGSKLYIYTPGMVKRYDKITNTWDSNPVPVSIIDNNGAPVQFVDPSAIIDNSGKIVLFYLNSTGLTGDPAGCQTYPCTKYFDSAVEVEGSDGTQFISQSGDRATYQLTDSPSSASDPDIFFDGTHYILYISKGQGIIAMKSDTLQGSYTVFPNLPNGVLTNQGGVPSGYFDDINNQYWTYVHSTNNAGSVVIRRAVHSDFNSQLTSFSTVLSGPIIGETSTTTTESPGITLNTFLVTGVELVNSNIPNKFELTQNYPNPFNPSTTIEYSIPAAGVGDISSVQLTVYDIFGREVSELVNAKQNPGKYKINFNAEDLSCGIYFYKLSVTGTSGNFTQTKKMILLR
ncbi:MAG: hypothetical protein IEMM0006_0611 [bacterium]|nr:MAG: hypothetical protein IEMM0006_0611 [bacterium]